MVEATGCHYPQQHQVEAASELFHDLVLTAGGAALPVSNVSALLQRHGTAASHAKYFAQAMSASTPGVVNQDEFVKGLAALDPVARHDDARKAFVFRVYQDDRTHLLDRTGLASMVRHIRRAKCLSTNSEDVAAATDKLCHRLGTSSLSLEDFTKATTFLRFTGTSELCRLPVSPFPVVHEAPATDTSTALDLEADVVNVLAPDDEFMAELETRLASELQLHNIDPTQAHAAMRSCCSGHGRAFAEAWVKVLLEQLGPPAKKDHVLGVELPVEWQACRVCQGQIVNCRLPLSAKMKATPDLPPPDYHLIDIPTESVEYSSIAADFFDPVTVQRVYRLQNRYTWARYCTSQKILCAKNQNMDANEQALYHCTRADLADICSEGLDYRYSNSRGNLGPGLYFSNNPLKCDSYAKPGTQRVTLPCQNPTRTANSFTSPGTLRVMLRCRVTLGKVKTYPKGSSVPELRVEPPGYQSVQGWFSVADEWCVKHSDQVYVSHLVFYEDTAARQSRTGYGPFPNNAPRPGAPPAFGSLSFVAQQPPPTIFGLYGMNRTAAVSSAAAATSTPKVIKTVATLDLAATPTQFITEGKTIQAGDTAPGPKANCPICLEPLGSSAAVRLKSCSGHGFHTSCLKALLKAKKGLATCIKCPVCRQVYGVETGDQPDGKLEAVLDSSRAVPGYNTQGLIEMKMTINPGFQGPQHPNPGARFQGTERVGYLPNTAEGHRALEALCLAFQRRLIFTVGTSLTTGKPNSVVWACIHIKTSVSGGQFGFPDPKYFDRLREELRAVGIPMTSAPA